MCFKVTLAILTPLIFDFLNDLTDSTFYLIFYLINLAFGLMFSS